MSTTMTNLRPGYERGKCHICEMTTEIKFCKLCGHWFDDNCAWNIAARAMGAIAQMKEALSFGPKRAGCCGPTPPEMEAKEAA